MRRKSYWFAHGLIMDIALRVSLSSIPYTLLFEIDNRSTDTLLIAKENIEVIVVASTQSTPILSPCELLKQTLKDGIGKCFEQQKSKNWKLFFKWAESLQLEPGMSQSFDISLEIFKDHYFFKQSGYQHEFKVTIKLLIPQRENSNALSNSTKFELFMIDFLLSGSPSKPPSLSLIGNVWSPSKLPSPPPIGKVMLEYRDVQPFYLNTAETGLIKLWISSDDQNIWVNHSDAQLKLNATLFVELTPSEEISEITPELLKHLEQQFNIRDVKLNKIDKDISVSIPINNPQRDLFQDKYLILRVTLKSATHGLIQSNDISVLLQRPSFAGHLALDFGTTNSAIAYYDPRMGTPDFQDRIFSDFQLDKLNEAIQHLMSEIENQVIKDTRYKIIADKMVFFAKMVWATDMQGSQVQSLNDIRKHFVQLRQRDIDKKQLGEWQAKLIVSWGNVGYNELRRNQTPLAVLNFVTQQYFKVLREVINIDVERDAKSSLPVLESGRKPGTIPSDIKMSKLTPLKETNSTGYPRVDGLNSEVDMGEAVKVSLSNTLPAPPEYPKDGREVHNIYLSAAKRGLGLKEINYFIDIQSQTFLDTYDPLCIAAIKELLKRTEQHINQRRTCLNNIVVTYPANLPQYRRESYRNIMQSLGIAHVDMSFDEATAAALYYVWQELFRDLFAGIDGFLSRSRVRIEPKKHQQVRDVTLYYQNILLYDMGGGTTDIVLLEIGLEEVENLLPPEQQHNHGRYFIIRPKILGLTGREDFGGDNVTLAVFRILKSKLASTAARLLTEKLNNEGKRTQLPTTVQEALEAFKLGNDKSTDIFTHWFTEEGSKNYSEKVPINIPYEGQTEKVQERSDLIDALVTTRFANKPQLQSIFFGLWQEAERIKQGLSSPPEGYESVPIPTSLTANPAKLLPSIAYLGSDISEMELENIDVALEEMERLIQKDVTSTFEKARNLCIGGNDEHGYTTKYLIDRLVLAGSSSHLRLVREKMPFEVLGKSFNFCTKTGKQIHLPAPFKHDGYNFEFNPKDAKLSVVRGGALPRYFKTTRVPPQDPEIHSLLKKGVNFLDFDVDNLRNYMPFTLKYAVGDRDTILFESGEEMQINSGRNGKTATRKLVPGSETLNLYRVDNAVQTSESDKQYYAQFQIRDEFIRFYETNTGKKLRKDSDKNKIDELMSKHVFWIEFDIERDMKCFMYKKAAGNDDTRYVDMVATVIDQAKLVEAIGTLAESKEGTWTLKRDLLLFSPVGTGGRFQEIRFTIPQGREDEPVIVELEAKVKNFRQSDRKGGITRFALFEDQPPLWQIDLQNYVVINTNGDKDSSSSVKPLVEPELHLRLILKNEQISLEYTVYDPNLKGENVLEIPMSSDTRKAKPPFNPYRGEE